MKIKIWSARWRGNILCLAGYVMKTIIINTAIGLFPMLEYELDIVQKELDKGNKVVFYCTGGLQQCGANNPKGGHLKNRYCSECKSRVYDGIKWLNAKSGMLEVADSELIFRIQNNLIILFCKI